MKISRTIKALAYAFTIILVAAFGISFKTDRAEAQIAGAVACKVNVNFSQAVPVWDQNAAAMKNVSCVGNGIAWQLARVALHALTTSVVNWINTGFEGSPSFVTDPEGFFLDTADQATGAFIGATGPLMALCSPFNLDIRLSLALGQTQPNMRYTCTLSQIIKTQKGNMQRLQDGRLVNVTVDQRQGGATIGDFQSGNITNNPNAVSINGASIDGFVAGDFSQGGWPAFWAMTTEPQNNSIGASLQAQSDNQMRILARQNAVNNDLNRGAGFLSWQSCDNVQSSSPSSAYGDANGNITTTKKVCTTETPGSVISSQLNKQLGAPTDELNLTSEINQVVSALFSQLVTKVLSNGLLSSSHVNIKSGATQSVADQLNNDPNLRNNFNNLKQQSVDNLDQSIDPAKKALADRNRALSNITEIQTDFITTRDCIERRMNTAVRTGQTTAAYFESQLSAIELSMAANLTPKVTKYQSSADSAQATLSELQDMRYMLQNTKTVQELSATSDSFATRLGGISTLAVDPDAAKADLTTSIADVKALKTILSPFNGVCRN